MGAQPRRPGDLMPLLALLVLMVPCTFAAHIQKMGNITFECPVGWRLDGPDCYLLVDVAMTFDDAMETCQKYGADVVEVRDEVEAKAVARMFKEHGMASRRLFWIGNVQKDSESVCEGLWDVGQPLDEVVSSPVYVAATVPTGRWQQMDKASRLPFLCRTESCVEDTFRCRDGQKCISSNWTCDGEFDCDDQSDESDCSGNCMFYRYASSGTLSENSGYSGGRTCAWVIEGEQPGTPITITFTNVDVEADVDYVEVWTGGPTLMTSKLQDRLTGRLTNRTVYGYNNFIIVRLVADLGAGQGGFVASWAPDDELSHMTRMIEATDDWQEVTSPHYSSDPSPCAYVRHYTVSTEEGSLITMQVTENDLGEGFEYDPASLALLGEFGVFPDIYVSRSNTFSFYLVSNGCEGPEKFRAMIKKGCSAEFSRANGFVVSPNAPPHPYPPSVTCTYVIRAPENEERPFQLRFTISELADDKDTVKVFDGPDSTFRQLGSTYSGSNPAPNTTFTSSGPVVFVEFVSSLVLTNGFFYLAYNLDCPILGNTENMRLTSDGILYIPLTGSRYDSEVTMTCNQGYSFAQEEFADVTEVTIGCGLGGKWNVTRLPTCQTIYCGVPESITNGFIANSTGGAQYGGTVTYQCFQGFTMVGSDTSTCGDGSLWSARPTCEASQCPALDAPVKGNLMLVTGSGTGFGTIYNYTCDSGYDLIGSRFTLCQTDGNWSDPAPTCQKIKCPVPEVARADLSPMMPVEFESDLTVTCHPGYVINGTSDTSSTFPCMASGSFDVSSDVCVDANECDSTPCTSSNETCVNTMGNYTCVCVDKYRRNSSGMCEVIDRCAEGTSGCDKQNGECLPSANREDFTCGCKSGYTLFTEDGTSGRRVPASEDGMMLGDVLFFNHTCVPVTCSPPQDPANGRKLSNKTSYDYQDRVEYRCDFGYRLTGDAVLTCNDNGQWDNAIPACELMMCDPLQATGLVRNIFPNTTTNPGDTVILECNSDATDTLYNKTLFCAYDNDTDSFTLQGDSPHCPAVDCGSLTPKGGAEFTVTGTGLGASFQFRCQTGFTLQGMSVSGDQVVTCQKNGRWGLGNLTCSGERCTDPGTPVGMQQTTASFEVGGLVIYNCSRAGFMPEPMNRTCLFDSTTRTTSWDASVPVCKDVEPPSFMNCPMETVMVNSYQNATTAMVEPTAVDNSGLVHMQVNPPWFSLGVPLPPGQLDVTYTASDSEGNSASCAFTIEVNEPGILPNLTCPDYLTLTVDSSTSNVVSMMDNVTTDQGVDLTFDPHNVTVGPDTVGRRSVRVTATNSLGFQRQCAFVVDIKPNVCLEGYLSAGLQNADKLCSSDGAEGLTCTVTCHSGSTVNTSFAFQDGSTSKEYRCSGDNVWTPSLPVQACVDMVVPEYSFDFMVTYTTTRTQIKNCRSDMTTKLQERIPTQTFGCPYTTVAGSYEDIRFKVKEVTYSNVTVGQLTAHVSLLTVQTTIGQSDLVSCGNRFQGFATDITQQFTLMNVSCGSIFENFDAMDPKLVSHGNTCDRGRILQTVGGQQRCVQCAPGNFYNDNQMCEECPAGQYQNDGGQSQCTACSENTTYFAVPSNSQEQCSAPCPLGFYEEVSGCMACPVDHYRDSLSSPNCTMCPDDTTTSGMEGATGLEACKAKCGAGKYPLTSERCVECPMGYYKSSPENIQCTACDDTKTTLTAGATDPSACVDVTDLSCQNGGSPRTASHKSYCVCPDGFTGEVCQTTVDACASSPCYKGTCSSNGPNNFTCECPAEQQCEMVAATFSYDPNRDAIYDQVLDKESCKQMCIDTADCTAMIYTGLCLLYNVTFTDGSVTQDTEPFRKMCANTYLFEGSQCENDLTNNCANDTCSDISFCRDMVDGADCVCPGDSKYSGSRCDIDLTVCEPNPCKNGGSCQDSGNGVRATCVCPAGFTGDRCETDIDECALNPGGCLYGGMCMQGINTYTCECGEYEGENCEKEPDFCAENPSFCENGLCYNDYNISSLVCVCEFPYRLGSDGRCEEMDLCMESKPCQNNATCGRVSPGVTECMCTEGYTGSLCQHDIDDCASMPCTIGTCRDLVNSYECLCGPGYISNGTNCENIDDCASSPCKTSNNTERCEDLVGDYRCVCKVGFTGKDCETDIDECLSLPCQHNGTCFQGATPGQYTCDCVDGWTGPSCENLGHFCDSSPCQSGGECYSLQSGHFCECTGGSAGTNCENTTNVCNIIDPCMGSGSTCEKVNGETVCQCPADYTGSSCNLIEDGCKDNPCHNGGTCMLNTVGYSCQCAKGYSGANCSTSSSGCSSVTCPSGSTCVEVMGESLCLCGAGQLQSGDVCKDASSDYDLYFARRDRAVRSLQPFMVMKNELSVTFWIAPLGDTSQAPVQLKLSNGSNVLAVSLGNVTFGDGARVELAKGLENNQWNQFSVTWNATHYQLYVNGLVGEGGTHDIAFPEHDELIFVYIGEDFEGYISQLYVWQRSVDYDEVLDMYSQPRSASPQDLVLGWSGYRLKDSLWVRVVSPATVSTPGTAACQPGLPDCSAARPAREPLTVTMCPQNPSRSARRQVQVNELFTEGESYMSNIDGTLVTLGANRLVFLKKDAQGNVGFCRFTAYVKRDGLMGKQPSCDETFGLNNLESCGSGNKGRKVQCGSGELAPLSPKFLTCGKLGSYNSQNPDRLPPAVLCGAASTPKYKVTVRLRYLLAVPCSSTEEDQIKEDLKQKVKDLYGDWQTLCPDSSCANADTSDVKCEGSSTRFVVAVIVLKNVPANLTSNGVTLTAKELLETATKEFSPSAFAIPTTFNAQLQNDAVIEAVPTCEDGQGLHGGECVVCAAGSYVNETVGMCQYCPMGSYTNTDMQTTCTSCPAGETTIQMGATGCVPECMAGQFYNLNSSACAPCPKNFYSNQTGEVYCQPCPAGKATEGEATTSADLCFDSCPAGTQLNGSECVPCPRGSYSTGVDVDSEVCVPCPAGNTTAGTGSTSINSCSQTACEPGQFRNASNMCEECDYGSFQPEKWQDECTACNDSYITRDRGSTSADQCIFVCPLGHENLSGRDCTACQTGFYRDASLEHRFMNCTACNSTFTTAKTGSQSADDCNIRICNAGSYRNETDNQCYPCPMGQYQPESLQLTCSTCPRNLTTKQEGSNNQTLCVFFCAAGYEVLSAENETCKACDRGKYKTNQGPAKFDMCMACTTNTTDDVASVSEDDCNIPLCMAGQTISSAGECQDCPEDTYQEMSPPQTSSQCMACDPDKGTKQIKSASQSDCLPVCVAGKQYNMTVMTCEPCPLGTYNSGNSSQRFEQCAACPEGFVTVNEMTGATSIDNCTLRDCPAGQYISGADCLLCPVGTYQDIPRQTVCKDCRPKTNTSGEGSDEEGDCTISCPPGEEQPSVDETCTVCKEDFAKKETGPGKCAQCTGNFTANGARTHCDVVFCDKGFKYNSVGPTCDPCEVGRYKDMRGNATECMECPANTTTATLASTSRDDCNKANCEPGFYSPSDSLPCLPCAVGSYKDSTGNTVCTACPTDKTTPTEASTDAASCSLEVCPMGQFRNDMNQCMNCSVGSYQNQTGQTECMQCPSGFTTLEQGADSPDDCRVVCPAGQYRNDSVSTTMCQPCPVGQYQNQEGQTECVMCPTDYTTNGTGYSSDMACYRVCPAGQFAVTRDACMPCPYGQYQPSADSEECLACSEGSTTLQEGSTRQEQCQPICVSGQYLNQTARQCVLCPVGTYNGVDGTNTSADVQCTACPEGNITRGLGAKDVAECNRIDCDPGSFRASGDGCEQCPVGRYQPEKSQTSCLDCDAGTTTLLPGRDDKKYCVPDCPDGQEYIQGNNSCELCKIGFYRNKMENPNVTECIKCKEGFTTNNPGQKECIEQAPEAVQPPTSNVFIAVRVKIRLVVKPCRGNSYNRNQLGRVIQTFIINVLLNVDSRFPAICRDRCTNVKITFKTGCLENFTRRKRATAPEEQEVEVVVDGVEPEVTEGTTNAVYESATVIERAFYDSQAQEKTLEQNEIEFQGVDNVTVTYQPIPGSGPLDAEGKPAGSLDSVNALDSRFSYGPCPSGTYSPDGTECKACAANTYQDLTNQTTCKSCPQKTYTAPGTMGAKATAECRKKCDEANAGEKYCSGRGTCTFDASANEGVRCVCQDGFEGAECDMRQALTNSKTAMVAGIAGGAGAFLVIVLIVVGIVACLRRRVKKGKKGDSESTDSKQPERAYSETPYMDYSHPMFASPASRALPGQPSLVYYNPEAYDQEHRDFYSPDRSTAPPSRQRSRSYAEAWTDLPDL